MTFRRGNVIVSRIQTAVEKLDDAELALFLEHLNRLGTVAVVLAGGAGLLRYPDKILPGFPIFAHALGIASLVFAFYLLAWISVAAFAMIARRFGFTFRSLFLGLVFALFCVSLGMGGTFFALGT